MRAAIYAPFTMRHHWTPKQIDEEIPLDVRPWLLEVESMIKEIAEEKYRKEHPE